LGSDELSNLKLDIEPLYAQAKGPYILSFSG